ncbi:hypothetical protein [Flavobacterium lipolyticum]|uniref:Uncharacterized protein n=1 Tax=Flavobacterium lipolyticum TaxID=2893754 RepID=A0ABS8M2T9_9FLAO|nr:hypothetical protein [Flavobacterium sp. F-126]MCC9019136.1 hypothetical protein [Flavobacterium sp. F-126]
MKEDRTVQAIQFLNIVSKMNFFTSLKPEQQNDLVVSRFKIASYHELNSTISSLLRTCIQTLKNDPSETDIDIMNLLEIALQLLPSDEMELLDELHKIL